MSKNNKSKKSSKAKIIGGIILAVALVGLILFLALRDEKPQTKTAEFYASIDVNNFWYDAQVIESKDKYSYAQAVKNGVVTTIEDREGTEEDSYQIFYKNYIHKLNLTTKVYDTEVTSTGDNPMGIRLLFAAYDFRSFNDPKSTGDELLEGKYYYCETFDAVDSKGKVVGENKYYFENERLKAIVWTEESKMTRIMYLNDYAVSAPYDIYFAPPSDFTAGQLTQTDHFDYSDLYDNEGMMSGNELPKE